MVFGSGMSAGSKGMFDLASIGKTSYKLNTASQLDLAKQIPGLLAQVAEFEGLASVGQEPDVLMGYFPLYLANVVERGKSNKQLRFRGIGGHIMWQQKGDGNTLILKFSLVGPLAPIYLQLLDMAYYYGGEYMDSRGINREVLPGSYFAKVGGSDLTLKSNGCYTVRTGQITDQGLRDTYNKNITSADGAVLPNDLEVESVANSDVNLNDAEISEGSTTKFSDGSKPDEGDWELIAKRRTFTVITKTEILPRMYIETMLVSERKDLALGEIEVDLLLRRYVDPPVRTRYYWTEAATESVPADKDLKKAVDADKKKLTNLLEKLKKKKTPKSAKGLANLAAKINTASGQLAIVEDFEKNTPELKDRTRYTAGEGVARLKRVTGVDPRSIIEHDKIAMWFNQAWRAVGMAKRLFTTQQSFSNDPIVGRIMEASNDTFKKSRAVPITSGRTDVLDVVSQSISANIVTGEDPSIPVAPHQSPSINNGDASSITYQQGITFNTRPELVAVTLNGFTGVTEYHVPLVDWRSFLHFIGEDETVDEIKDALVTQENKQADLENTIIYGCNVFKVSGDIPHDGLLSFSSPIQFSFRMQLSGSVASEQNVPKMNVGVVEFTVQPGLVYYLGTSTPTSWYEDEDDGLMHVNKPVEEEMYFYCKNIQVSGIAFSIVGYFFYPLFGA